MPGYYTVTTTFPQPITPSPTRDNFTDLYYGQVDLNAQATDLNKQIAGSSIGAICGFTVIIIVFSVFWE